MAKLNDSKRLTTTSIDAYERKYTYELYNGGIEEFEDSLDYVNLSIKGVRLG